jgi:subtilisin family serine protease/uncharacterized membrane protein
MPTKMWYRIFTLVIVLGFLTTMLQPSATLALPAAELAAPAKQAEALAKIEPLVLEQITAEGQSEFFIWLGASADLSAARNLRTKAEKGQYVYNTLRETAERSQSGLRAALEAQGVRYRPFYIANKIFVQSGDQGLVMALAARPDVARITANHQFQLPEPFVYPDEGEQILDIETNISFIRAPEAWALGITGEGTVMAGNDTGLSWDHPALINHYRGYDGVTVDHNYSWWDATSAYPMDPFDGHGHGTHTTGTMVGDDGGSNQIGVAPGAKTIHCRNMDSGGGGSDYTFSTCFEWDLAPWDLNGENPRPDLAPHAVNNSWGYWGGGAPQFEDEIDALQAAGIVVEVSAGNEGATCQTLRSPGDYAQVLTTGSVDHSGGVMPGTISGFSSRGSSTLDPGEYMPDVMAPGENIRSSLPGGVYSSWGGTSMAGPHVTALVGLMWSANPGLQGMVDITYDLIKQTAVPLTGQPGSSCGGDYDVGPNNDWGYGTVDALAAVEAALLFGDPGTLQGTVSDSSTGLPIPGVQVSAVHSEGFTFNMVTDDSGFYSRLAMSGTYEVTAYKYGYLPQTVPGVIVEEDIVTVQDFVLDPAPTYTVSGTVTDAITGWPLYAGIDVGGAPIPTIWADPVSGQYSVSLVAGTEYTFTVDAWVSGYLGEIRPIGPLMSDTTEDFALQVDIAACTAPGYEQAITQLFQDDFESGYANWSMDGLWNAESQADTCGSWVAPFPSPQNAAYYGVDGVCNYDMGSNSGSLTMLNPVELPPGQAIFASLDSFESTECGGNCTYDKRYMEFSDDGGANWTTIIEGHMEYTWNNYWLHISGFSGNEINLRFRFDSVDEYDNENFGWMVDNVALYGVACTPLEGSLVVGNVYDHNTSLSLDGATVSVTGGDSVFTYATPLDPAVDDGFYTLFAPSGEQTLAASKSAYQDDLATLTVTLFQTLEHDFYLDAGWLVSDPNTIEVDVEVGETLTTTLILNNSGLRQAAYEIFETGDTFFPTASPSLQGSTLLSTLPVLDKPFNLSFNTHTAPEGYRSRSVSGSETGISALGDTVAVFKDVNPWGTQDVELFLAANSIAYEVHNSFEFGSLDFSEFGMIVISGDQNQTFYDNYAAHVSKFEDYVAAGGFLNFFASDGGWNGGALNAPLPGGMNWSGWIYEDYNTILDPDHPVVEGVPSPFYGSSASHGHFSNLPADAHVIATETSGGQPTIVEYPIGLGWVIAFGQPLEISHNYGWEAGLIMENTLFWGYEFVPFTDIVWMSEAPVSGSIQGGNSQEVEVTFDATLITEPGDYIANLYIRNDTPYGPLTIPVTMHVIEHGVRVRPTTAALSGAPGETVTYEATITNTGNVQDTFTIALQGNTWDAQASHTSLTLAAGASAAIQIQVTIPSNAEDGDQDVVTAVVTSQGDPAKAASSTMTTTAEIEDTHGVNISPASAAFSGVPGETVIYTDTITNTGNVQDTFTIVLLGNAWGTQASHTSVTLAAGASVTIQVQVTIPPCARHGQQDTVTATVTSQFDPAISDSATKTTIVDLPMIYMPYLNVYHSDG